MAAGRVWSKRNRAARIPLGLAATALPVTTAGAGVEGFSGPTFYSTTDSSTDVAIADLDVDRDSTIGLIVTNRNDDNVRGPRRRLAQISWRGAGGDPADAARLCAAPHFLPVAQRPILAGQPIA